MNAERWSGWSTTHTADYQLLLQQVGGWIFQPRNDHTGITIDISQNGQTHFSKSQLDDDEVTKWAATTKEDFTEEERHNFRFQLLICAPRPPPEPEREHSVSLVPIPLSRTSFQSVEESFRIHSAYLPILFENAAVWARFKIDSKYLTSEQRSANHTKGMSFVVRDNTGDTYHCASTYTYLPSRNTLYGVIQGLQSKEVEKLVAQLPLSLPQATSVTWIPSLLLQHRLETTNLALKILANNIYNFEQTLRMLQETSLQRVNPRNLIRNDYKWNSVGRGLTTFSEGLALVSHSSEIDVRILDFLDEFDSLDLQCQRTLQSSRERLSLLRSRITGTQYRISYLEKRTRTQIQTLYNLIAQRDNAVSIQLAEASKVTSEASLRDNQAMKDIAAASQKDSAAMRMIAIVTIIFLPGTFTATLFSANFLNLQPQQGVVSYWIWVYVALTLLLTIGVFIGYWVPMRRKALEIDRLASTDSKEKVT